MTDFTIYMVESVATQRANHIYTIEVTDLKIVSLEQNAIVVRGSREEVEKLAAFDWVTSIEPYDCYIVAVPNE